MAEHFPYRYDRLFAPMWFAAGVLPWRGGVTLTDDDRLVATFGLLHVDTPLSNVAGAHVTEGYRWWTAIGPRLSFSDDGLTFGTNHRAGTCIHFRQKIHRVLGLRNHSALTVTVADPIRLASTIKTRVGASENA